MAAAGVGEVVRACLAGEEKAALEAMKVDICQWLGKPDVLALDIAPASFLDVLDSGVQLCKLAGLVQEGARRRQKDGRELSVRVPLEPLAWKLIKASRGSAMFQASARDNASYFIQWCRSLGVEEAVIFESVGLVEHTDEKRVILCLLDVARVAEKVGISPPQLVALEREIEQMEEDKEHSATLSRGDETESRKGESETTQLKSVEPSTTLSSGDKTTGSEGEPSSEVAELAGVKSFSEKCHKEDEKVLVGETEPTGKDKGEEERGHREVSLDKRTSQEDKVCSEDEGLPPTKRIKRVPSGTPNQPTPSQLAAVSPHTHHDSQSTQRRRSSPQHDRQRPVHSSDSKKATVDQKVKSGIYIQPPTGL